MSSCLWIPQPLVHCALYCTLMGTHSAFDSTLVGETTSSSTRMGTHCKLNGTFIGAQAWGRTEKSMARPWESTHTHTLSGSTVSAHIRGSTFAFVRLATATALKRDMQEGLSGSKLHLIIHAQSACIQHTWCIIGPVRVPSVRPHVVYGR